MEFTALWDSVNLASRLEGVNKFYWTYICVSEETYNEVNDKFIFRYLDKIRVKWKNLPIKIYELICFAEENYHKELYSDFEKAIRLYEWRKFSEAETIFSMLAQVWDKPSKTYLERCKMYIKNPPKDDWDGVWTMDSK
jgi:adenylate cyclase